MKKANCNNLKGFYVGDLITIKPDWCDNPEKESKTVWYVRELYENTNRALISLAYRNEKHPLGLDQLVDLCMIQLVSDETPDIIACDWCNTGGGIYIFIGTFADNTHFILDDNFDVRILDIYPAWDNEEIWYEDEQMKHLVRDLNTERAGAAFVKKVFKFLRDSGDEYIDSVKWIEDQAIELDGKRGWR